MPLVVYVFVLFAVLTAGALTVWALASLGIFSLAAAMPLALIVALLLRRYQE